MVDKLRPGGQEVRRTLTALTGIAEARTAAYFEIARRLGLNQDRRPTSAVPTPAPKQDRSFREVNI